jgi:hypothetical protein
LAIDAFTNCSGIKSITFPNELMLIEGISVKPPYYCDSTGQKIIDLNESSLAGKTFVMVDGNLVQSEAGESFSIEFNTKWGSTVMQLPMGAVIVAPEDPVNGSNAKIGFKGWSGFTEGMKVTGNMVFNATWVGDVNGDSYVNLRDLLSWKTHYTNSNTSDSDDINLDGNVNLRDILRLKSVIVTISS